jgi:hypothetical protein
MIHKAMEVKTLSSTSAIIPEGNFEYSFRKRTPWKTNGIVHY